MSSGGRCCTGSSLGHSHSLDFCNKNRTCTRSNDKFTWFCYILWRLQANPTSKARTRVSRSISAPLPNLFPFRHKSPKFWPFQDRWSARLSHYFCRKCWGPPNSTPHPPPFSFSWATIYSFYHNLHFQSTRLLYSWKTTGLRRCLQLTRIQWERNKNLQILCPSFGRIWRKGVRWAASGWKIVQSWSW